MPEKNPSYGSVCSSIVAFGCRFSNPALARAKPLFSPSLPPQNAKRSVPSTSPMSAFDPGAAVLGCGPLFATHPLRAVAAPSPSAPARSDRRVNCSGGTVLLTWRCGLARTVDAHADTGGGVRIRFRSSLVGAWPGTPRRREPP